ncbi:MAG: helix-turn-helix transcriptional regulator [Bacteroidota bacterium]
MKKEEGVRLKQVRNAQNKTQQETARILNIGRTAYTNYENGVSRMPDDTLDVFVREFGTTHEYIKGRTAQMWATSATAYADKSLLQLIELLPESDLKGEIRQRAVLLIESDAAQKQKIIALHEYKDELLEVMRRDARTSPGSD